MKKLVYPALALFVMLISANSMGQNPATEKIRERYQTVKQQIDDGYLSPVKLGFSVNRPGIGMQNTTVHFYWNNMSSEAYGENPDGTVDLKVRRELMLTTFEYNVSGGEFYYFEFLYDTTGKMVFCFRRVISSDISEERFYFGNDRLIYAIYRSYERNDDSSAGKLTGDTVKQGGFGADELAVASHWLKNGYLLSAKFGELFTIEGMR